MATRGYSTFGKLGRELAENLDVLIGVDQAEKDDEGRPATVGRITRPDGSSYELRVVLLKEGTTSEDSATVPLNKSQKEAVEAARAKRRRQSS